MAKEERIFSYLSCDENKIEEEEEEIAKYTYKYKNIIVHR